MIDRMPPHIADPLIILARELYELAHALFAAAVLPRHAADSELFGFIMDTYWVQYGGGDPADFIKRLSGRMKVCHSASRSLRSAAGAAIPKPLSGSIK